MTPADFLAFVDAHNGALTAIATIVIASFTIILVWITGRQAHLTRIAAEAARRSSLVAERALTELERPFLAVDVLVSGISVDMSGALSFVGERTRWAAINYGRTPAILVDRLTNWPIEAGSAMPYAIDPVAQRPQFPAGCVSSADKPYGETANLMAEAPIQTMLDQDAWRNRRIFFNGYIRYQDLLGGLYVNGFCLVFDPLGSRFVRIGGETFNYTKTEKTPAQILT